MIEELDRLVEAVGARQRKLILIVGPKGSGKSRLLRALGERRRITPLLVGSTLGNQLLTVSQRQRPLQVSKMLGELATRHAMDDLLLMDNIELLFDRSLQLDPLAALKQHAHAQRVVAVWPMELHGGRLAYAQMGHPEYQNYAIEGFVTYEIWPQ